MSKWLKGVSVWVFGLLVAAALAFGARTAFAEPVTADCPYDGWVYLGSCIDTPDCREKCQAVHGQEAVGTCNSNNCCRCYF